MRVKDACAAVVADHPGAPSRRDLYDAVLRSRSRDDAGQESAD
jgi:16S rRNA (cytidine1402-2'-O)-methyltransferase